MSDEKRKFLRFDCSIPSEVLKLDGNRNLVEGAKVINFSSEGLRLRVNFVTPKLGSSSDLKLYLPERQLIAFLSGEIVWYKFINNKLEVGLKIKDMKKEARGEVLNWVFPKWLEKEKRKQEDLYNDIFIRS